MLWILFVLGLLPPLFWGPTLVATLAYGVMYHDWSPFRYAVAGFAVKIAAQMVLAYMRSHPEHLIGYATAEAARRHQQNLAKMRLESGEDFKRRMDELADVAARKYLRPGATEEDYSKFRAVGDRITEEMNARIRVGLDVSGSEMDEEHTGGARESP